MHGLQFLHPITRRGNKTVARTRAPRIVRQKRADDGPNRRLLGSSPLPKARVRATKKPCRPLVVIVAPPWPRDSRQPRGRNAPARVSPSRWEAGCRGSAAVPSEVAQAPRAIAAGG